MKLDKWQEEVMQTKGNICLRSGRQVGKSTVIAKKAALYALKNRNKSIMVVASVERQALLLFEKILSEIYNENKEMIKLGKDKPTRHKVSLTNGSVIHCLPTGQSGYGIRGFTIDLLIADEAAFIPEEVWSAITPMLAVTKGDIILLSTPFGKQGYFYRAFEDKTFTSFHVSSEQCPRVTPEFLEQEKRRMSTLQYAQEYLGEFVDELRQLFPDSLIRECMERSLTSSPPGNHYLGIDVARMGGDETVLAELYLNRRNKMIMTGLIVETDLRITDTIQLIKQEDNKRQYKRIYIDDGGLGVGVFDPLHIDQKYKRRVVAINNSSRSIDKDNRHKKLLKEDLYSNLLNIMETGSIQLLNDERVFNSLRSVQAEYTDDGRLKIFGKYTHIAEALIRAAWCRRDKGLNIYVAY